MNPDRAPNAEVLARLKELFDEVDEDKSGAIDYPEMIKMLKEMNLKNPEFFTVILWYILNKTEKDSLKYDEFKAVMLNLDSIDKLPQFLSRLVFVKLDTDDSGTVELAEFFELFKDLNQICSFEETKKIFDHYDKDKTGSLDYKEFKRFFAAVSKN